MRMIVIDAKNQEVREDVYTGLESLQKVVEGYIEAAHEIERTDGEFRSDTVYVNEEGLIKAFPYGFIFRTSYQPLVGNGVIVGTDFETGETIAPKASVEEIKESIIFLGVKHGNI